MENTNTELPGIDIKHEFEKWMSDRGDAAIYIGDGLYSSGAVTDQAEAFAAGVELARSAITQQAEAPQAVQAGVAGDERKEFDAWCNRSAIRPDLGAWEAWQARATLAPVAAQQAAAVECGKCNDSGIVGFSGPTSEQNARFAIDAAIQYGRENRNQPPSTDHWLYEYWNIGRQLAKLGETAWDNVTSMAAAKAPAAQAVPLLWALVNLNNKVVFSHESRATVEYNQPYIRTPTRVVGLCAATPASTPEASQQAPVVREVPEWRVGEFWSSARPGEKVLMLATGIDIENFGRHKDFIRWLAASPATVTAPAQPVELMGVAEEIAEGSGFWRECSGCYDTEDGRPTQDYAYSHVFSCALGNGCSECGGIGAVWDNTDYEEMARGWDEDAAPAAQQAAPTVCLACSGDNCPTCKTNRADTATAGMVEDAKDAARYRGWRDHMLASDAAFIDAMQDALPTEIIVTGNPTADQWDAAIDAALAAQQAQARTITQAGFIKPSAEEAACTCPSGDGSLRWPCPTHPPGNEQAQASAKDEGGAA